MTTNCFTSLRFCSRFCTTPLLITHTLLNVWSQTVSVETKSRTTQQELSRSGVSAPTCETFEIAVSSYTYPLHAHTQRHTHTHTHTHTHRATFTLRGLTRRRILIRLHPKLPPTGPEGDMNLKRQCSADMKRLHRWATGTPVKTCYPERHVRREEERRCVCVCVCVCVRACIWELNVQETQISH